MVTILLYCAFVNLFLNPNLASALDLSDEKELGRKVLEQVKKQMRLIDDGEIVTYVQSVGNRIVKQLGTTLYDYQFFVVDAPAVNAFAVPGGYVFVYRGLIEILQSEGELASIISHELAHIQARHIERRMQHGRMATVATLVGALASAFLGLPGNAAGAVMMGTMAGSQSMQLKYSRENEEEADELGFRFLRDAGYDPGDMVKAMQALGKNRFNSSGGVPSYLSTHPLTSERIQYLQVMVDNYRKDHPDTVVKNSTSDKEFNLMRAALVSEYSDPRIAEQKFKTELNRGRDASAYGLGRLYLREGQMDEAITYLRQAAGRHPDSPMVLSTLGSAYYQTGQLTEAQSVLQSALLLDSSSTSAKLRLALVLKELGKREEALQNLQQIEKFAPSFPEIDYHLGVLLGQMNQVGRAHYHLGRYHQQKNDFAAASFHYNKARTLLAGDARLLAEIDEQLKDMGKGNRKVVSDKFHDNVKQKPMSGFRFNRPCTFANPGIRP